MAFDVDRARAETPGCEHVLHLNNAGSSLQPQVVLDAQVGWLQEEAITGGYELADRRRADIDRTYDEIAALIGARREEIAVVENATFGWHQAFWSLPLEPGTRIVTCRVEYASSYISFLQAQRRLGVTIEVLPDEPDGSVSVAALDSSLGRGGVGLVAIAHIPTNGGLVNPAEDIGALTRAAGVPYLLDACQSVGQMPVDVDEIGCSFLTATGRKFLRGPRGTGFLYVESDWLDQLDPAFLDLHGATWVADDRYELRPDARRFENWESNVAAGAGLGVAVAYARSWGMGAIAERVTGLAEDLRTQLAAIDGVEVRDLGRRRCGIVTFTKDDEPADDIQARMAENDINVSVSRGPSTLLDSERRDLPDLVRASVHYYNDEAELSRFCEVLAHNYL
jgi:cysteine desulfurase / selenocysteine lyase